MAFPNQAQIDIIATQILLDAKQALLQLQAWNNSIQSAADKMRFFKELIKATAAQMGGDLNRATAAVQRFAAALNINPQFIKSIGKDLQATSAAAKTTGEHMEDAFHRAISPVNALRIALGAIISMLLFQFIQAVTSVVRSSIEEFTELEDALWRIQVAERSLSEQGVEVSVEGLKKGIEEIKALLPIFSEQDIAGLVGKISISTKELGYTEDQIIELSKAIAILNVVSTETEDVNATASKVITALLSGTTKGISGLGVQLNDTVIKAKAVELGFISVADSLEDLTKEQKDFAKLAIVLGTAEDSLGLIDEFLASNSAKLKENTASWDDLLTALGGFTATIIPALTGVLEFLTDAINSFKALSVLFEVARVSAVHMFQAIATGAGIVDAVRQGIIAFQDIPKIFDEIASEGIPKLFAKMPANAPKWFKDLFGDYLTDVDTATDLTAKWKDELEENEDVLKSLAEIEEKIKDIILDAQQAQEDLDLKLEQKQEDLDLEYIRKEEDAAIDHAQNIVDINQDAVDKKEDAIRESQEDQIRDEFEFQQALKELRNRFLMDLEEALHARDARAVLRLMKEYKFEKQQLYDRKALEDQLRQQRLDEELRQIELERQRRIESEQIEYQRKLEDLATAKAREQEELATWYAREQEDIQRNVEQKLEKLLAGYIAEEKLHVEHQEKIKRILEKYFGDNMALMGNLTSFMAQQFAQMQAMAALPASMSGAPLPYWQLAANQANAGGSYNYSASSPVQYAEGGSVLATRPTTAMFGERGPELATFTPLGRRGADVGKLFGDGSGGMSGNIVVAVNLSPDLEGRIIERSMDGVGEIIARVNNTKVR